MFFPDVLVAWFAVTSSLNWSTIEKKNSISTMEDNNVSVLRGTNVRATTRHRKKKGVVCTYWFRIFHEAPS